MNTYLQLLINFGGICLGVVLGLCGFYISAAQDKKELHKSLKQVSVAGAVVFLIGATLGIAILPMLYYRYTKLPDSITES